jgi:NADH:quinone reductase (non-electrogenic)
MPSQTKERLWWRIVEVDGDCSTVALSTLGDTWRALANDTVREVPRLEAAGARRHEEFGELIRRLVSKGRVTPWVIGGQSMVSMISAAGLADAIEPLAAIVERLMRDTLDAFDSAQSVCQSRRLSCIETRVSQLS